MWGKGKAHVEKFGVFFGDQRTLQTLHGMALSQIWMLDTARTILALLHPVAAAPGCRNIRSRSKDSNGVRRFSRVESRVSAGMVQFDANTVDLLVAPRDGHPGHVYPSQDHAWHHRDGVHKPISTPEF